ncbi:peptidoglycan-binding domain-containing protein [Streptomyces griseoincarnatus]
MQQHTGRLHIRAGGGVDAIYGDGTVEAVRRLRADRLGVSADGVYGPDTRAAMLWPDYWRDPPTAASGSWPACNPPL